MAKSKTSSYILTLPLKVNKQQEAILHKRMEIGRKIYNTCLGLALKRYTFMSESNKYRKLKRELKTANKKFHNATFSKTKKELDRLRKSLYKQVGDIYKEHNLTNYGIINSITAIYKPFNKNIDNKTAQAIGDRVWSAIDDLLSGKADKVHFKKYGEFNSLQGKWNKSGMKFNIETNTIDWNKLSIPAMIKSNDMYAHIALNDRVKFVRIVRKTIRGKYKFYAQLVLEGIPPKKFNHETGEVKNIRNEGVVGLDIGTQTIAVCSNKDVKLLELAPNVVNIECEKRILQRKLDRQRRNTNPDNYNEDGTIKKGMRLDGKIRKLAWIKSKKYINSQNKLKELNRKQKDIRKQSHEKLANYILTLGNVIKVEDMNYKGLQKRTKKTTINEKTGKFNRKKRFGKSLANKAPAMLLEIINRKLSYDGLNLLKVNTYKVRASQYNHFTDVHNKKELSDRWNNDINLQRDLYSSFLIMNVKNNLNEIDRNLCFTTYSVFKELHDIELNRLNKLKMNGEKLISSMGI